MTEDEFALLGCKRGRRWYPRREDDAPDGRAENRVTTKHRARKQVLAGLIHCPVCGRVLQHDQTTYRGRRYRYYACPSRSRSAVGACGSERLRSAGSRQPGIPGTIPITSIPPYATRAEHHPSPAHVAVEFIPTLVRNEPLALHGLAAACLQV